MTAASFRSLLFPERIQSNILQNEKLAMAKARALPPKIKTTGDASPPVVLDKQLLAFFYDFKGFSGAVIILVFCNRISVVAVDGENLFAFFGVDDIDQCILKSL